MTGRLTVCLHFLCLFGFIATRAIKEAEEPYTLNEFLTGSHSSKSFNGSWLTDNSFLYRKGGDVVEYNVETRISSIFLNGSIFNNYTGASYTISKDRNFALLRYNVTSIFRHSTTASFTIYDIANKNYYDIVSKNQTQLAQWAPSGHGLVYVYLNNIYYLPHPSGLPTIVTTNGIPGVLYNGVPDWVYEEEVLGSGSAIWFSPNGKSLAFASFHDENVTEFSYFIYGKTLYPTVAKLRYPKVGTTNPRVQTYIVNLERPVLSVTELKTPNTRFSPEDYILYDIAWPNDNEIAIISSNRVQNESELVRCTLSGSCLQEASYKSPNGWLDIKIPRYLKNGQLRLEILPQSEGNDSYNHLVLTNRSEPNSSRKITEGRFDVTTIYGFDEARNTIYLGGSGENGNFSQQHVYSVVVSAGASVKCLTCAIQTSAGPCLYAAGSFSKNFSYWASVCQGPGPILSQVRSLLNANNTFVWEDNEVLREKLALKLQPKVKNLKVPVANGFIANVRLLLPPGLNESSTKKYPAIVNVYGGPNSNQIRDAYSAGFQNYITTNRQYIYIYIDGRGSGRDGRNKLYQIYKKMGTVEIEDQISVTKYLQDNLSYIDRQKTGIWGWSYGGFATAWVLAQDTANVFHCGLSVAPVTNFIYYDSIYTERYMGLSTPQDNLIGYNNSDVTSRVEGLRNKLFFLIHGNADDNVHYQQSMILARALELADISFYQQSYPDENHSLGGVSRHLYHTIDRYWASSFGLPDPPRQIDTILKESV